MIIMITVEQEDFMIARITEERASFRSSIPMRFIGACVLPCHPPDRHLFHASEAISTSFSTVRQFLNVLVVASLESK
jgi:hypothetical protein